MSRYSHILERVAALSAETANVWIARWWGLFATVLVAVLSAAVGFAWSSNAKLSELSIRMEVLDQERAATAVAIREGVTDLNRRIESGIADLQKKLDTTVAVLAALQGRTDVLDARLNDHDRRIEVQERAVEQLRAAMRELERLQPPKR